MISKNESAEHTLEFLLAFDGRIHWLEQGYRLRFEIQRVEPTPLRPHGLRYSFTLHDPEGFRIIGFDNAHAAEPLGGRFKKRQTPADHWHRTEDDKGRPYEFVDADKLLQDFFTEVRRVLSERGISEEVVRMDEAKKE
jgi:hypothetical protein